VEGLPGAELDLGDLDEIVLAPDQRLRVMARIRAPQRSDGEVQHHFRFVLTPIAGLDAAPVERPASFYTPN
jgi:hypothetical protein